MRHTSTGLIFKQSFGVQLLLGVERTLLCSQLVPGSGQDGAWGCTSKRGENTKEQGLDSAAAKLRGRKICLKDF